MPYSHNTRDTNVGAPLNLGDDYDYLYIDYESPFFYPLQSEEVPEPVVELFNKRVQASGEKYKEIRIDDLLGGSILLDKKTWDFKDLSKDMQLFKEYTSEATLTRGYAKINAGELQDFDDQIGRKMKGMLYLKDSVRKAKGPQQLDVYSGTKMIIRCSDANPRKLIRLFKALLNKIPDIPIKKMSLPILTPTIQSQVLVEFSESALKRVQSEERIGPELFKLMTTIGNFMSDSIHSGKINTQQISSIKINSKKIPNELWHLIERAVDNGLLYPNIKRNSPAIMPIRSGEFRIAHTLTPYFRILPRRGDARSLNNILSTESNGLNEYQYLQQELF